MPNISLTPHKISGYREDMNNTSTVSLEGFDIISLERYEARMLLRQIKEALEEKQPNVSALELSIINQIERVLVNGTR